jgi:putative ABC transport system permease protein
MLFWMIVKVAYKSLNANKLRSLLAMLGIIIGVGAVIAMLAIGAGVQQQILAGISAMGSNLIVIRPGQRGFGGVMSGTQQNLTVDDASSLLSVKGVETLSPVVNGRKQVKYLNLNTSTNILGVAATYFGIRSYILDHGTLFADNDVETRLSRVAELGPVTATNLFGNDDPVGKTIKISGINFTVLGVFKAKGDQGFYNPDDQIILPYRTAMKELFGTTSTKPQSVGEIDISAVDGVDVDQLIADLTSTLRNRHHIQDGAPDDVNIQSQSQILAQRSDAASAFTLLLGVVGGMSLLVGGIGIMNIMLVTVTERTREIGIRKAIGAKDRDVLAQFLIEAILMSGVGGLFGVCFGVAASYLLASFTPYPATVHAVSVIIAFGFSALVGIFFGYYPATRAAKLDPIEALRYE